MVRVRVTFDGGRTRKLVVSGHAGQAAAGEDIVCAGVSALVETLRIGIQQVVPGGVRFDVQPGHAVFEFEAADSSSAAQAAVVDTIVAGLRDLAGSYPHFVRFEAHSQGEGG
jgi:uncharacterized protein YsxB (DUF464 family)